MLVDSLALFQELGIDFISYKENIDTTTSMGRLIFHITDFSVVLFRPNFMLASEEHLMKVHKNQWLSTIPSPPDLPYGATNQGLHHGVRGADAFAVT
jgi:hypothetical protein